jgi:hypothetical protein
VASESGILQVARDGVWLAPLTANDVELSAAIEPLFYGEAVNGFDAVNWDAANTMAGAVYKGRYYLALPTGDATTPNIVAVYSRATGQWYFYDHPARSLYFEEDTDRLLAGFMDGQVYILETGTADGASGIALDVEKDEAGTTADDKGRRKLFLWASIDADCEGETLTVLLYVDGTLRRTTTITGARTRQLIPFPAAALGFVGRVRVTYTGTTRVAVYALKVLYQPLEAA